MDNMNNNPVQEKIYTQYPIKQKKNNGMSIASMVLGIISLVMCCFVYVSIPCAVISMVLGCVALGKGKNGKAIAGIIMSAIALALGILVVVSMVIGGIAYLETNGIDYTIYNWGF